MYGQISLIMIYGYTLLNGSKQVLDHKDYTNSHKIYDSIRLSSDIAYFSTGSVHQ